MLPEFSPVETPEYLQAVEYARKTRDIAGELMVALHNAQSDLRKHNRALRSASKDILATAERAELRRLIKSSKSMIAALTDLHAQADAVANRAWAARTEIAEAQYQAWKSANPAAAQQAENDAFSRQLDYANRERQDRRTRKAQLIRQALSA